MGFLQSERIQYYHVPGPRGQDKVIAYHYVPFWKYIVSAIFYPFAIPYYFMKPFIVEMLGYSMYSAYSSRFNDFFSGGFSRNSSNNQYNKYVALFLESSMNLAIPLPPAAPGATREAVGASGAGTPSMVGERPPVRAVPAQMRMSMWGATTHTEVRTSPRTVSPRAGTTTRSPRSSGRTLQDNTTNMPIRILIRTRTPTTTTITTRTPTTATRTPRPPPAWRRLRPTRFSVWSMNRDFSVIV